MESTSNKKIMTFSFLILAFISFWVMKVFLKALVVGVSFLAQFQTQLWFSEFIPLIVGVSVFLFLVRSKKARLVAEEALVELWKVVWPTSKEVKYMTLAACAMLLIAGCILWIFDITASNLVKSIVN